MGLLDLPSPLLTAIDGWLTFVPPAVRIAMWGAVGAVLSMELYRVLSPQKRIARMRQELKEAQARLDTFDGPFPEAWRHIRRILSLAMGRLLLVFPATLIASLPVLFLLVWADTRYGDIFPPPGQSVSVQVAGDFRGRLVDASDPTPTAEVTDPAGNHIAGIPLSAPVSTIAKWQWWNLFVGNPAGYLPGNAPFDRIEIALPRQHFIAIGPDWLRGWEPIFFASTLLFAMALKFVRRIE